MGLTSEKHLKDHSDASLVEQYCNGQREAFAVLVQRYRQELYYFLARFTGDRNGAEDLFQETFLQVHQSAKTFDTSRRFKPWLFMIAANKARDYLRRNLRRQAVPLSATVGQDSNEGITFLDLLEAELPLPAQEAERQEIRQLVRDVVTAMPEHMREVLLLAYFHRFTYQEIADLLSVPLGTVKSRLHAAVATFAKLWKRKYEQLK